MCLLPVNCVDLIVVIVLFYILCVDGLIMLTVILTLQLSSLITYIWLNNHNNNTFYMYSTFQETQRHFTCEHKSNTPEKISSKRHTTSTSKNIHHITLIRH